MRINEYTYLEEFTNQYTGEWNPSEGHWLGLDFSYNNKTYRLHTGPMFNSTDTILENGEPALFGLYQYNSDYNNFQLLKEYATMDDLLNSYIIDNRPFSEIIIDDSTELLGQD